MAIEAFNGITPRLGNGAWVHPRALVLGDVVLGDDSSVWPMAVVRGDEHRIRIGAGSNVQDGSVLHVTHAGPYSGAGFPLLIGDGVTIGHGAVVHACTIGDDCLIGMSATLLDGVVVGNHCLIGAGAVVSPGKQLPARSLWVGNPARMVRILADEEIEQLRYSAKHYIELKGRHSRC